MTQEKPPEETEQAADDPLEKLTARANAFDAIYTAIAHVGALQPGREHALAMTKLEEAAHWLEHAP